MTVKPFSWAIVLSIVIYLIVSTVYFFFIKDTRTNYSIFQSYKEYYSVGDWNLTQHAIVDLDNDGIKDMVTFTNCVFLSSLLETDIQDNEKCEEPTMSGVAFPDYSIIIGRKLSPEKPFTYNGLQKSYLVKTHDDHWKYYDMNGFQLRTYAFIDGTHFVEVNPSTLDIVDMILYQLNHIGLTGLVNVLSLFQIL